MYDTLHPAVVRAMRLTVDAAHRHGCEVGICGEFAGCAAHAELLVGLGFDELSVAPPSVPAVKERIRGLETPQAELTARRAVGGTRIDRCRVTPACRSPYSIQISIR